MLRRAVGVLLMVAVVRSRSSFRARTNSRPDLAEAINPVYTPLNDTLILMDWESRPINPPAPVRTAMKINASTRSDVVRRKLDGSATNSATVENMTEARRILHELLLCVLLLVMLFMLARCHYNEQTLTLSVDSTIPLQAIHDA